MNELQENNLLHIVKHVIFCWDILVMILLRNFGLWDILVICITAVSKPTITVFISLYFQTFWPKQLNCFLVNSKTFRSMTKKNLGSNLTENWLTIASLFYSVATTMDHLVIADNGVTAWLIKHKHKYKIYPQTCKYIWTWHKITYTMMTEFVYDSCTWLSMKVLWWQAWITGLHRG